jgi:hypothetical protein
MTSIFVTCCRIDPKEFYFGVRGHRELQSISFRVNSWRNGSAVTSASDRLALVDLLPYAELPRLVLVAERAFSIS